MEIELFAVVYLLCILIVHAIVDAGGGGYTYLLEPLWWAGMITSMLCTHFTPLAFTSIPVCYVSNPRLSLSLPEQ